MDFCQDQSPTSEEAGSEWGDWNLTFYLLSTSLTTVYGGKRELPPKLNTGWGSISGQGSSEPRTQTLAVLVYLA